MGHLVYLEILDLREKWVLEETKDSEVRVEKMECVAHLAYKEKKAEQVTLECWVNKEKRVIWEILGRWDHQVYKELQDWPDSLASRVYPECLEILDHQEDREMPVPQVRMARTESTVNPVILVQVETEESLVKTEVQEYKV